MLQIVYNRVMKDFIFDLYNTLIDIRTDEHREQTWLPILSVLERRGIVSDHRTLGRLYDENWDKHLEELYARSRFAYPEGDILCVYKGMANAFGLDLSDREAAEWAVAVRRASVVHMRRFDGVSELFSELRGRGARLFLLSNAQSVFTRGEIEQCGLSDAFDGIMLSSDHGCRKPDPAFFGMLFDKYKIDKRTAVMVGDDSSSDGAGAAAVGIAFVLADGGAAVHGGELIKLAEEQYGA